MYTPLEEKYINELKTLSVEFLYCVPRWSDGFMYQAFFPNGYGISVVKHDGSYGHQANEWEIAVLKGTLEDYDLCYSTPITSDVIGWLNDLEVIDYARQIAALPAEKGE